MIPLGRCNFITADAAEDDARDTLVGIEFVLIRRTDSPLVGRGDFAWVTPRAYANRLIERGVAETVRVVE